MNNRTAPLGNFVEVNPDSVTKAYPHDEILYIDISSVGAGHFVEYPKLLSIDEAPSRAKRIVRDGDTILATVRPNLRSFLFIRNPDDNTIASTGFAVLRAKENADPRFVYYAVTDRRFTGYLTSNTKGTSYPAVDADTVLRGEIPDFDLLQQQSIASILSAYDNLIENNQRRIQLLERAARLLYKEWFVHLRFPGHEHTTITNGIPTGWERKQIKYILEKLKRPRKIMKAEFLEEGPIPCIDQSRDFVGGYTDVEESIVNIGKPVIVFGDHTRILKFVDFPFACGADGTQLIVSNDEELSQEYLYFALDAINLSNYFYARHFKFLKDQYILRPPSFLVLQFTEAIRPMMNQVKIMRDHNYQLAKGRDLLLSRLMNGELAV